MGSMACMALRVRFSSTCSTMVRLHSTAGRWAGTFTRMVTSRLRACSSTSDEIDSYSARGVTASRDWLRRCTKSRTVLMTLPAREDCSPMRCMATCTSPSNWRSSSGDSLCVRPLSRFSEPLE